MRYGSKIKRICYIAAAICINYIGGQLALALRLPIYLDSIGTLLISFLYGPITGMLTPLISGLLMAVTGDVFSLYFAPVGMILGLVSGFVFKKYTKFNAWIFVVALIITIPGTLVCSIINAILFHGVTSSGSSVLVQILSHTPLGLTGSIFVVQILTDYLDRLISAAIVLNACRIPMFRNLKNQNTLKEKAPTK